MAPTNSAAWLKEPGKPLVVDAAPYTEPGENEIVVKASAVAINPLDHVMITTGRLVKSYPTIVGADVAGTVAAVGPGVTAFAVGDRVLADSQGILKGSSAYSMFQLYPVVALPMVAKIPDTITDKQAVALPLAVDTASACLFQKDNLGLAMPPTTDGKGQTVLIWGGSTAVGCSAIQLAAAAGYEVVAVAGRRHAELMSSLGAAVTIDHSNASVVDELAAALRGKTVVGAACMVKGREVHEKVAQALVAADAGVRTIAGVDNALKDVVFDGGAAVKPVFATTVAMNGIGQHIWTRYLPEALANGSFLCKPDPLVSGHGLEAIQGGIDRWAEGVSAQKVVVTL